MGLRYRRVLAIGAAVVAGLVALLVATLHLPPVRSRALAFAIAQLESRFDLLLTSDRLSYNLLSGGLTLTNVRLAARRTPDQPFFTAARVRADVPLAAYMGRLSLDDVEVDGGRFVVVLDEAGRSNMPGGRGGPPPDPPRSLTLRGLHLKDFTFLYDDRSTPMRIAAAGIDSALDRDVIDGAAGATGPFSIRGGVDVQWRDRALRVEPFDTRLSFDGRNVALADLPLVTTMGSLNLSGRLNRVLDALSLELGFDGQIDVARAATWAPPPIPVAGTSRVRGTLGGPTSAIEIVLRFDAPALTVGTEQDLTASGELVIDRTRLSANRLAAVPHSGGELNAALEVPFGDHPVSIKARWHGVDARALMRAANIEPQPIGTRLDGSADFRTGSDRSLTLATDLSPLQDEGVTPLAGRLVASLDGQVWSATHDLRADGVTANGRVGGRLDAAETSRSTVSGPATVAIASLAAADRALAPFGIRIPAAVRDSAGAIDAEATVAGTFGDPRVSVAAQAPAFEVPGVGPSSLEASVNADRRAVEIAPLSLSREGTEASGHVSIDLTRRALGGEIRATIPDAVAVQAAVPERWRLGGALDATGTLGGTFDAPRIDVRVTSPSLTFAGDTFEALDGQFVVTDTGIDVSALSVQQDLGGRLDVSGRYGFDRTYAADLKLEAMTWGGILVGEALSRVTVNGRFNGSGSVDRPMGDGQFGFAITGGIAGDLVGEGTVNLELFGDIARVSAILPSLGAFANATIATAAPYDYRGVAVVNQLDVARLTPLLDAVPGQLTGQVSLTAAVTGAAGSDAPAQVQANLQQVQALVSGVPLTLISPATVLWQPGEVTVRDLTATLGAGTLNAEGTWAGRENATFSGYFRGEMAEVMTAARAFGVETEVLVRGWMEGTLYGTSRREDLIASFDVTNGYVEAGNNLVLANLNTSAGISGETLTLHAISGRLDAAKAGGTFTGKGRATIPNLDPMLATGRFELDSATFDSAGVEVKQTRPTTIGIDRGRITMEDVVWEAAGSQLAVGGSVDVSAGSPALNLTVQGIAVLRVLSAFVPNLGVDGTADVDLRVGGTAGAPDLSGSVTLFDAEVALSTPRIVLSGLAGPIVLSGNRVELRGVTGSANGGSLTIDGGLVLRGTEIVDGEVYVQAVGMAVEYPRGLRSEIDALITYDVGEGTPILRGDVRVQRSAYTDPISLAALARANSGATVRPPDGESALENLRLNITVETVEDLRVDNNYGRFEGGAQVRIVGTAARPGMSGQVTLREGGRIYAAGRTFTLARGTISFTDLNRIQPDLDIQAETRVANIGNVVMTVQGTPDRFEFDLTAPDNPDVSREEIASALLGGAVTSANALTLLSADLLGATGRQIGLDALRIERGDVVTDEFREDPSAVLQDEDPVTRLTLSKRLSEQVEFTLSQNLAENGKTTILVSYYPLQNLELRAISRDDGTQGVGIRHQITFGGDSTGRRSAAPRTELLVNEVLLEGAFAPFTAEEVRKDLKVSPGDAFDFYQWQEDIDDVTARYVERGHFEARVRGRRDPAGEDRINVVYIVSPGPPTRIVVDGFEVPKSDLEDIQQAWARGVFDRFIVQDAEAQVQELLLSRGYVNGSVSGTMESSSDFKTLHLTVVPGAESGDREMRFMGNAAIGRNELETAVLQWNMADYGWIDRPALAGTLRAYYRQQGYLLAEVAVDAPVEEGGRAILPVKIEEGPRATIRDVQWSGVSEDHRLAAERAAGLSAGAPYALALVEGARDRVERRYRGLGHNSVEVTANANPADDGQHVDVSLAIKEGPQQVLQDVQTFGASRTRDGVVRRALHLAIGQPVNLEEWSLARKRLFDTNVFRSVDIQAVPLSEPVNGIQPVVARVTVEEYPPWRFRYGLQADREPGDEGVSDPTDINLGAIAEIRNQNLFGRAITGGAATRIERDFQRAQVFLQSASFLGLPLRSGLFLTGSKENFRRDGSLLFAEDRQVVSFEQRWRRRRGFEITYGYRFERLRDYDPEANPDDPFPFDVRTNIGRLRSAFLWDRRDDPVSPTRGTFTAVAYERAASWLASDSAYGRILIQQFAFKRFGSLVLAGRVIGGDFTGEPTVDLFQAGGATSVRGYGENALGPPSIFESTRGGRSLLILNQEARFPMYRWIQGVGFVDVGNAFGPTYPFEWSELKIGYGLGLRLSSPVGLLRLDYGIPGSTLATSGRRANDFGSGRLYFGLGHIF